MVPHPLFARENVNRHPAQAHHHHGSMATCTVTDGAMQPTNPSEVVNADRSSTPTRAQCANRHKQLRSLCDYGFYVRLLPNRHILGRK